ncbi:sortase domain-bontaining protein [Streptomyces sp. NPDC059720]|uniref:class F sortase n=1 Tax=Streptomyces sp. NPDC059720 TaxID=3346924 RepID=UPI0036CA073A
MSKPWSRHLVVTGLVVALLGLVVSVVLLVRVRPGPEDFGPAPSSGVPQAAARTQGATPAPGEPARGTASPAPAKPSAPSRLSLPRLEARAQVVPVGVASDGQVQVPRDPKQVGWYRYSPAPGASEGSAVVVGHVDSDGRGLGVLVALNDVRRGDRVLVDREDGSRVAYRVTSRRTIGKEDLAASGVFRREGPAVLTLITCAGPYRPDDGGYQNNLVVTAVEAPT